MKNCFMQGSITGAFIGEKITAHNDFLHLAAIAGLPAMLVYILLGSVIGYSLLRGKSTRKDSILNGRKDLRKRLV